MARKTDRNFLVDFAALDIEYLPEKGPEVSSDIQMVYVMGNVVPAAAGAAAFAPGWATPDPIPRSYGVRVTATAVVGERARFELLAVAGGGGLWVYQVSNPDNVATNADVFTLGALSGLGTTLLPTAANATAYGDGGAATAIVEFGASAGAAPASAMEFDFSNSGTDDPAIFNGYGATQIFIGPGRVFVVQLSATNTQISFVVQWREIA